MSRHRRAFVTSIRERGPYVLLVVRPVDNCLAFSFSLLLVNSPSTTNKIVMEIIAGDNISCT